MPLVENKTKLKLKNNELALGFGVHHLRSSATAMLAAATDHDWLFIDMEHGAHSVQEATQICLAALPTGVTPIVRICAGALDEGTRCLDNGALGVIVPQVAAACRASGKSLGMGGVYDKETATRYIKAGARMVLSGSDHTYLLAGATARAEVLRGAV
jgi:2-keto-3-deoxy-L-rhamnonate aldolase RhmA